MAAEEQARAAMVASKPAPAPDFILVSARTPLGSLYFHEELVNIKGDLNQTLFKFEIFHEDMQKVFAHQRQSSKAILSPLKQCFFMIRQRS